MMQPPLPVPVDPAAGCVAIQRVWRGVMCRKAERLENEQLEKELALLCDEQLILEESKDANDSSTTSAAAAEEPARDSELEHNVTPLAPTAAEYCRWGLSARAARHIHTLFEAPEDMTTAAVCHTLIKARTTPLGWEHRASPSGRRYVHEYVDVATGRAQSAAMVAKVGGVFGL